MSVSEAAKCGDVELLRVLLEAGGEPNLVVEAIEAEEDGKVRFHLRREYLLEVLPDGEPDEELWQFMPKYKSKRHFITSGTSNQR